MQLPVKVAEPHARGVLWGQGAARHNPAPRQRAWGPLAPLHTCPPVAWTGLHAWPPLSLVASRPRRRVGACLRLYRVQFSGCLCLRDYARAWQTAFPKLPALLSQPPSAGWTRRLLQYMVARGCRGGERPQRQWGMGRAMGRPAHQPQASRHGNPARVAATESVMCSVRRGGVAPAAGGARSGLQAHAVAIAPAHGLIARLDVSPPAHRRTLSVP